MNILDFILRSYKYMILPKLNLLPYYYYIANQLKIPVELIIAHAEAESNQYYLAVGPLGEYGLWQFLPKTWNKLMGNANWKDIKNQVSAYIKHTLYLTTKYKLNLNNEQDQSIFLWCWNAGEGNYINNILPNSTKKYIAKILEYKRQVFL